MGPVQYAAGNDTGTTAATDTIPHTATLVNPTCAKRLHRHYSGQPALLDRHHRRITTAKIYHGIYKPPPPFGGEIKGAQIESVPTWCVRMHILPSTVCTNSYLVL